MMQEPFESGTFVKHFKAEVFPADADKYIYLVIGTAIHTETNESFVCYRNVRSGELFIRPYGMFYSEVDHDKYPAVTQKFRFEAMKNKEN